MMKEVYPFSDALLYQVTLPHQTGSIAGMMVVELVCFISCIALGRGADRNADSEPGVHIGRPGRYGFGAGKGWLIQLAFLR